MNELNADIKLIKNVDQWSEEKWAKLSPVHLLISALPMKHSKFKTDAAGCLSQPSGRQVGRRTYPERDSGKAFFDFYDIKDTIERNNGSTPLLWALENVPCYYVTISRFLEMEPIVFDASDGEGKRISRYVWTNIPDQNFKPKLDDIFERYNSNVW